MSTACRQSLILKIIKHLMILVKMLIFAVFIKENEESHLEDQLKLG